jgi:hypothetical protein
MALSVQPLQNQPTLNGVVTQPSQPTLNPQVATAPTQATLNPQVQQAQPQALSLTVTQPQQPQLTSVGTSDSQLPFTPKFTPQEFASKIKEKYPVYASLSEADLTQKMLTKYPQYADKVITPEITPTKPKGFLGKIGDAITGKGNSIITSVPNIIGGFAKEAGKTLLGASKLVAKIPGTPAHQAEKIAQQSGLSSPTQTISDKVSPSLELKGGWQKLGGGLETVAELAAPTDLIAGGKAVAKGVGELVKVPESLGIAGKALNYVTQKVLSAIPEATFGGAYGLTKSGGDIKEAGKSAVTFGALSGAGEVAGDVLGSLKGNLTRNVQKALGMTGSMNATQAIEKTPKAIRALKFISNLAPDIKVLDEAGVEKVFDPSKATFYETMQAWTKARDMAYQGYTDLAKQAGDKGAVFSKADFNKVISDLNTATKDSTGAFKTKAASLIKDMKENFGFRTTDLQRMQDFVQKVNTDINPLSDKAGSEVSAKLSQSIREILDNKISGTTGEGYQTLRNSYSDLKSIEKDLVNQFKKAARGSKGFASYVEGYGALDVIVAAISHNPVEAARGGLLTGLGALLKRLRDPEVNLQSAFKELSNTARTPGMTRMIGTKR